MRGAVGLLFLVACGSGATGGLLDGGSTPRRVACGATASCPSTPAPEQDAPGESYCCVVGPSTGDPLSQQCMDQGLGTCESGFPFYCDETADCGPGLRCCQASDVRALFSCSSTCAGPQLCRTDAECAGAGPCKPFVCDGEPIGVCGGLTAAQATTLGCSP